MTTEAICQLVSAAVLLAGLAGLGIAIRQASARVVVKLNELARLSALDHAANLKNHQDTARMVQAACQSQLQSQAQALQEISQRYLDGLGALTRICADTCQHSETILRENHSQASSTMAAHSGDLREIFQTIFERFAELFQFSPRMSSFPVQKDTIEVLDPTGYCVYRRPPGHPDLAVILQTPGYSLRHPDGRVETATPVPQ